MGAEARNRQAIAAAAAEKIANAIPFSRHRLVDAYNKPIEFGGMYAIVTDGPVPGSVVDISPVMDRTAPPDTYRVTLVVQLTIHAMSRAPIKELIWVAAPPEFKELPQDQRPGIGEPAPDPDAPPATPSPITLTDL